MLYIPYTLYILQSLYPTLNPTLILHCRTHFFPWKRRAVTLFNRSVYRSATMHDSALITDYDTFVTAIADYDTFVTV